MCCSLRVAPFQRRKEDRTAGRKKERKGGLGTGPSRFCHSTLQETEQLSCHYRGVFPKSLHQTQQAPSVASYVTNTHAKLMP